EDRRRKELVELKNQADNLLLSYESTIKDNSNFIGDQMKTLASEKVSQLQAAMIDSSISTVEFKQRLDDFQQTLFAIGADVYNRANSQSDEIEEASTSLSTPEVDSPMNGTLIPQFNFDFDEESTAQVDYEAID
ncbi:MAG: Hsp70 family protein, partial [Nostoc sp. C3-bin3]|nr:Hsp70 family protein [Nostoc sp. C3-bin3]